MKGKALLEVEEAQLTKDETRPSVILNFGMHQNMATVTCFGAWWMGSLFLGLQQISI